MPETHRPPIALRLARSTDAARLLDVQRAAIRAGAATHYEPAVIADWAPLAAASEQVASQARRIAGGEELVVVATDRAGTIHGFASAAPGEGELRALYVAPALARQGIGSRLLERLEELVASAGVRDLHVDASLNAEAFYRAQGYTSEALERHRLRSGRTMACVSMRKRLTGKPAGGVP